MPLPSPKVTGKRSYTRAWLLTSTLLSTLICGQAGPSPSEPCQGQAPRQSAHHCWLGHAPSAVSASLMCCACRDQDNKIYSLQLPFRPPPPKIEPPQGMPQGMPPPGMPPPGMPPPGMLPPPPMQYAPRGPMMAFPPPVSSTCTYLLGRCGQHEPCTTWAHDNLSSSDLDIHSPYSYSSYLWDVCAPCLTAELGA